jgi:peptide/nickel transport system substrate-binding protein
VVTNTQGGYIIAVCRDAKPWNDPKFREAFDLALDRDQINQVVMGGKAEAMSSLWPASSKFAVKGLIDTDGDVAKAKQDLADIGWDGSQTVKLAYFGGFPIQQLVTEVIGGQLEKVGIKSEVQILDSGNWQQYLNAQVGAVHIVTNTQVGIEAVRVTTASTAKTVFNPCGYSNPDVSNLINDYAQGTQTEAEQVATWSKLSQLVEADHAYYPLITAPAVYVYNKDRVQGLKPGVLGVTVATNVQPIIEGVSIKK